MSKQKFQVGDHVMVTKGLCKGATGIVEYVSTYMSRKIYHISFDNEVDTCHYYSYELEFTSLHDLTEHAEKYGDIPAPPKYEYPTKEDYSKKDNKNFQLGDIVKVINKKCACYKKIGIVIEIENNIYKVGFNDKYGFYTEDSLIHSSITELYRPNNLNNQNLAKCKYCGEEFDEEFIESEEEPGACEFCVEQKKKYPKVHMRKSIAVDLKDFSIFGKDGDWLEVTEWTNGEGVDISIHYASDHDETNRDFTLSYDELSAIMNIVNKFGTLPTVFTKKPKND